MSHCPTCTCAVASAEPAEPVDMARALVLEWRAKMAEPPKRKHTIALSAAR